MRVAAIGDLHCTKKSQGQFRALFAAAAGQADILVLCGDLTDYGLPEETEILIKEMAGAAKLPTIAVLGNHDFESGREAEVHQMLVDAGIIMLDGDAVEVRGIGFAGAKGFAGGFGRGTLGAWGEPAIKAFVQEAVDEAMKLEAALARLRTGPPDRGAALCADPGHRRERAGRDLPLPGMQPPGGPAQPVSGHGRRPRPCPQRLPRRDAPAAGVPVYNVSLPLLRKTAPDRPHFRILEIPVGSGTKSLAPQPSSTEA